MLYYFTKSSPLSENLVITPRIRLTLMVTLAFSSVSETVLVCGRDLDFVQDAGRQKFLHLLPNVY